MKKFLLVSFLTVILFETARSQALYVNNTNAPNIYNPGLGQQGTPKALLDDVNIPSAQIGGSDSFYITRVKFGVYRQPNAAAVTVRFYYSTLNDTATSFNGFITVPPVLIGTANLPANGATGGNLIVNLGDSINPFIRVKADTGNLYNNYQTIFLGLSFSEPLAASTGWRFTTPTQSFNDDVIWIYNADSTVKIFATYFSGNPRATFYLEVYGRPRTALPITLSNFDGRLIDDKVELNWNTATEINNKGFDIQRSADGVNFSSIRFVTGSDNSTTGKAYSFTDVNLLPGTNYYRLKQTDKDGRVTYSRVLLFKSDKVKWTIYPNPTKASVNVSFNLNSKTHVSAQLLSMDGKVLQTLDQGVVGAGVHQISVTPAATGTYFIRLTIGSETTYKKISKL
jgi:hypothetical protein